MYPERERWRANDGTEIERHHVQVTESHTQDITYSECAVRWCGAGSLSCACYLYDLSTSLGKRHLLPRPFAVVTVSPFGTTPPFGFALQLLFASAAGRTRAGRRPLARVPFVGAGPLGLDDAALGLLAGADANATDGKQLCGCCEGAIGFVFVLWFVTFFRWFVGLLYRATIVE